MINISVSPHAIQRYQERIEAVSDDEAYALLSGPAVQAAAKFGARVVRLPQGRIILDYTTVSVVVLTVLPIDHTRWHLPAQLLPVSMGGPPPISRPKPLVKNGARS